MTQNNLLVSIIIPVYDVDRYLKTCLDSLINQTYKHIEIILINDCSPDTSQEIIEKYISLDSRIQVIQNEVNQGIGKSRDIGTLQATGTYLWYVDPDDYVDLNALASFIQSAIQYNFPDVIQFQVQRILAKHNKIIANPYPLLKFAFLTDNVSQQALELYGLYFLEGTAYNKLIKRSVVIKNNLQFQLRAIEDSTFTLRLAHHIQTLLTIPIVGYFYMIYFSSATRNTSLQNRTYTFNSLIKAVKILDSHPVSHKYSNLISAQMKRIARFYYIQSENFTQQERIQLLESKILPLLYENRVLLEKIIPDFILHFVSVYLHPHNLTLNLPSYTIKQASLYQFMSAQTYKVIRKFLTLPYIKECLLYLIYKIK